MAMTQKKQIGSDEKSCNGSEQTTLVLDLFILILERLSFADFRRGRCVSSEWYYASKSCIRETNPWLILFPREHDEVKKDSCKLFDPRDQSLYLVRDLGFDFARSVCLATCGNWFLMLDEHGTNFHLLNLFTRDRIPLPSLESIDDSEIMFMRVGHSVFYATLRYKDKGKDKDDKDKACRKFSYEVSSISIRKTVLWVDEKSRDYLVVWSHDNFLAYQKRGDNDNGKSWKTFEPLKNEGCVDMVFKESKLYLLRKNGVVTVFDFSRGDSPMECASFPSLPHLFYHRYFSSLAVTLSGEILIISSDVRASLFTVYKMDPKSSEWKVIESLGDDETLLLDLGITVAAKGGVVKNCIYYDSYKFPGDNRINWPARNDDDKGICVYNIKTNKVFKACEQLTASSTMHFMNARWFFPTFG